MTTEEFFKKYAGQGVDFDGAFGFQCMDLAEQYNREVVGAPRIGGNAIDAWNNASHDFYDRIPNTPTNVPLEGDIMIWSQGVGPYGHIAIFDTGNAIQFTSLDQNWPVGSICHFQQHSYKSVLGWLRPKILVPVVPQPPVVIPPVVETPPTPEVTTTTSTTYTQATVDQTATIENQPLPEPVETSDNLLVRFLKWLLHLLK